ncbi:MAG: hypothetical protein AAGJ80_02985, partial [Cyanobacteria bacterium J06553_1]
RGDRIQMTSDTETLMSDRFSVTLADGLAADLQQWANEEGRAKANLASFLIELAIRQKFPEKYPPLTAGRSKKVAGSRDE